MILHRRVKGGVLLYALLMLSIFALILQFYLHRSVASSRNLAASREATEAQMMAELSRQDLLEDLEAVDKTVENPDPKTPTTKPNIPKSTKDIPKKDIFVDKSKKTVENIQKTYEFQTGYSEIFLEKQQLLITVKMTSNHTYTYCYTLNLAK